MGRRTPKQSSSDKKKKGKNRRNDEEDVEVDAKELDRFAGSSEEEIDNDKLDDDDDDDDDESDEDVPMKEPLVSIHENKKKKKQKNVSDKAKNQRKTGGDKENPEGDSDDGGDDVGKDDSDDDERNIDEYPMDDDGDDQSSDDDDDDEGVSGSSRAAGMANAMSRILGLGVASQSSPEKGKASEQQSQSVVLSKTTTPLQRQAAAEKAKAEEVRQKRLLNREGRELKAHHIPTLLQADPVERTHRRVATRGVVALFNAIAQHQQKTKQKPNQTQSGSSEVSSVKGKSKEGTECTSVTNKHSFLEMIKNKAKQSSVNSVKSKDSVTMASMPSTSSTTKPKWNALDDDFLLNPKKRGWDEESSDSDGVNEQGVEDDDDEDQPLDTAPKRKKVSSFA